MESKMHTYGMMKPRIAVIDPNILSAIGMRGLLQSVMPGMDVETYTSFEELQNNHPESFAHFFVSTIIVLANQNFFLENRRKTIVLTTSPDLDSQLSGFHCLCTNAPKEDFIKQMLALQQSAHGHGHNLPPMRKSPSSKGLSNREIEVLACIVKGMTNKEVANTLNIGLTTVITHRKNIQEKLGIKSVSSMTIYAVSHGLVNMEDVFGNKKKP
jgi:DNA-binding CsgD family transcriptional regulator